MAKTKRRTPTAGKGKGQQVKRPLSHRERTVLMQMTRLVYCWRYVCHEQSKKGLPIPPDQHGYNLLVPNTPQIVDYAYDVASHKPLVWQVLMVSYVRSPRGEYRNWAWVISEKPIIAAGEGITPLLTQANRLAMEDVAEDEDCYARGTIMAPWDAQRPITPDRLAARLQSKLRLTKEDVLALTEWEAPTSVSVEAIDLDLQVAKALRQRESA